MTLSFKRGSAGFQLLAGTRKVFDTALLACALVPAAAITVAGQVFDYPDPVHDNAYYWNGSGAPTNPVTEQAQSFVTLLPEEHAFTDILLGTVPTGTDYLDVQISNLARTTTPSQVLGVDIAPVPPLGVQFQLQGGSCLLEELDPIARGFDVILSGTNVYLRRYQSVTGAGAIGWSAGNNASTAGAFTWGTNQGPLAASIQYVNGSFFSGGAYTHRRGDGSQLSLSDSTNYHSVYTADLVITPGYFITSSTLLAPLQKTALRLASYAPVISATTSVTFSSVPFGLDDSTRQILVAVEAQASAFAGVSVSGVTIGGVAATRLSEASSTGGMNASIWMASVPTGSSGNIVVTYGANIKSISAVAYALYHLASTTPVASGTSTTSGGTISLATASGGFAFGCYVGGSSGNLSGFASTGTFGTTAFGLSPTSGSTLSISSTFTFSGAVAAVSLS